MRNINEINLLSSFLLYPILIFYFIQILHREIKNNSEIIKFASTCFAITF